MNLAGLFSGGKDSTYSIHKAIQDGHHVKCLITVFPLSEESMLLHYPSIELTKLQANAMGIPQIYARSKSVETNDEVSVLKKILQKAKDDYSIEGIVHGGILSEFQKKNFEKICSELELELVSPIWHKDQKQYMNELLDEGFHFIIISASADGLDDYWLGKEITKQELEKLIKLSNKYKFNLNFEGGEAETFVINCPVFSHPIKIKRSEKKWDGYRGRFEILEANLDYNAR